MRSLRIDSAWREELPLILEREAYLADDPAVPQEVYVGMLDAGDPVLAGNRPLAVPCARRRAGGRRRCGAGRASRHGDGRVIAMRALQLDYQRANRPVPWLGLGVLVAALLALAADGQAITRS